MIQTLDVLQSKHQQEELTGKHRLVEGTIPQQSRLMEPYGLGERMILDNWELMIQT